MEFSSGKLWEVCTLCPVGRCPCCILFVLFSCFTIIHNRWNYENDTKVDKYSPFKSPFSALIFLSVILLPSCLSPLSLLNLFPPLNPQRYLWISFSIFGKRIYFKREIKASQLPSSSYPGICSILILFCLFLLCVCVCESRSRGMAARSSSCLSASL